MPGRPIPDSRLPRGLMNEWMVSVVEVSAYQEHQTEF